MRFELLKAVRRNFCAGFVLLVVLSFPTENVWAGNAGVRIVSPADGQEFAPGQAVTLEVDVSSSLQATDAQVSAQGLGILKTEDFQFQPVDGRAFLTHFKAGFVIPDHFAGSLVLEPGVFAGSPDVILGDALTIHVSPSTAPQELVFTNRNYFLSPGQEETQIYVTGKFKGGTERDLTSPVTGTTYTSSDPAVISVDQEGLCRTAGRGMAVITVENRGVRGFVMFVVEDEQKPNASVDLTGRVSIARGSQREEENGLRIIQPVTVTNASNLPLTGPLWLKIDGLTEGSRSNDGGIVPVSLPDGLNLFPGQSVKLELTFLVWQDVKVDYTLKLFHGQHEVISQH